MPDYSQAKIYQVTNDKNNEIYIGSTCDSLHKRFSHHKALSKDPNKQFPMYKLMNEIGFERFAIKLVEDYPCETVYELRQREGYYIRKMGTLNALIAGRDRKQYTEDNRETISEKTRKYHEENKEVLNAKKREKVFCTACDCWFSRDGQARHNRRLKHIEAIKLTNQEA